MSTPSRALCQLLYCSITKKKSNVEKSIVSDCRFRRKSVVFDSHFYRKSVVFGCHFRRKSVFFHQLNEWKSGKNGQTYGSVIRKSLAASFREGLLSAGMLLRGCMRKKVRKEGFLHLFSCKSWLSQYKSVIL